MTDLKIEGLLEKIDDFNNKFLKKKYPTIIYMEDEKESKRFINFPRPEFSEKSFQVKTRGEVLNDSIFERLLNDTTISIEDLPNLSQMVDYAYRKQLLPDTAYVIINELTEILKQCEQGNLSDKQFEQKLDNLIAKFDMSGFNKESASGKSTAAILAITDASYKWWKENPEARAEVTRSVASTIGGYVLTDASGAIWSVLCSNKNNLNWGTIVKGAAGASLGMVGKIKGALKVVIQFLNDLL